MHNAPPGDAQIIWARALIAAAIVPTDIERVAQLADGGEVVPGLTIDQDMRWSIALKYVGHGMDGAEDRLAEELATRPFRPWPAREDPRRNVGAFRDREGRRLGPHQR